MGYNTEIAKKYLKIMLESREGDRREGILLRQNKGWFQVGGTGHEAMIGFSATMRSQDWFFPYYRDRAMVLGKGLTSYDLALSYLAKKDSTSGGRQMPGHFSSQKHNIFSVPTPTGANLLPACGVAWAAKRAGDDVLVYASIGDAASRQGEFYEALAFAVQEKLPMIFLIQDNKYGISTNTEKFFAYNLGGILSEDYVERVDATSFSEVINKSYKIQEKVKSGNGPSIAWCSLERLSSHTSSDDHRIYRSKEDLEEIINKDPIEILAKQLISSGDLTEEEFSEMKQEVVKNIESIYIEAEKAEDPIAEEVELYNWSNSNKIELSTPPIELKNSTMVESINKTLEAALDKFPSNMLMFGEDIEDPKGGVFGITKGLSSKHPNNVINSPLAEATILGVAVGVSLYGIKPVFELQFMDFITPAWNQVSTNLSSLRWRTYNELKCPMVIYSPYGAYLPGGSLWHSQSNEALIAHLPGIEILVPSTPEDAAGMFWSAIHNDNPTFILIPKHIFRKRSEVKSITPVPIGKAKVIRDGTDITIVSWGNTLEIAHSVAESMSKKCSIEIIDLRSIIPCDYDTINKSIEKTGRLIVIHEDIKTCGFGESIISEITSNPESFNLLLSSPQLVARKNVHIGYNPVYEYAALPSEDDLINAIYSVMDWEDEYKKTA